MVNASGIAGGTLPRVDAQREELATILPPLAERIRVTFIRDAIQAWYGVIDADLFAAPGAQMASPRQTVFRCRRDIVIALNFWTHLTEGTIAERAGLPTRDAVAYQLSKWHGRSDARQLRDLQRIAGVFLFVYSQCFGKKFTAECAEDAEGEK